MRTGAAWKIRGTEHVALATITVTAALTFTTAHCPAPCNRRVMSIPGVVTVEVRRVIGEPSGRGRTCFCRKCFAELEVIEHE